MKDITAKALEYIEKAIKLMPEDHRDYSYFTKYLESYNNANEIANTDEKVAILYATTIKVVHQITSILFRLDTLTDEIEKEYREFPLPEKAEEEYQEEAKKRTSISEILQKELLAEQDKQADIDVFIQVVNGRTVEEANQKLEDYKAQTATRR